MKLMLISSLFLLFSVFGSVAENVPETVLVPAGPFLAGSTSQEREYAYQLDEKAYGHSNTRKWGWYDDEPEPETIELPDYRITKTPITNAQYAEFIKAIGHRVPDVDPNTWAGYKLIHPYERTRRHAWRKGSFPKGRADHPVVMVSYEDVQTYARWLSGKTGKTWRLPTGQEWEKAIRGTDGRYFPWGNEWDSSRSNTHENGPFDTLPVNARPKSVSPFGLTDAAGQVFEWTSDPRGKSRHYVRGGSWDDSGCGVCRPAARHSRPDAIKHILVGFRLVQEID